MSAINTIGDQIRKTEAEIQRLELVVARHPDERTLQLTLQSLQKRRNDLELDYAIEANIHYVDVCRYRMFSLNDPVSDSNPAIAWVSNVLQHFQDALTLVYAAFKEGSKQRGNKSPQSVEDTLLRFGYSFSGSLGFGLTISNERILLDETNIEKAVGAIFDITKAKTTQQISDFADILGPAPIKSIYQWANAHTEADLGVDIEWTHDTANLRLQAIPEQLRILQELIEKTSDEVTEQLTYTGTLVALDVKGYNFRFVITDSADLKGKIDRNIVSNDSFEVPGRYVAEVTKKSRLNLATGQEEILYVLTSLSLPKNDSSKISASEVPLPGLETITK